MDNKVRFQNLLFPTTSRAAAVALEMALAVVVILAQSAQAQALKVLYNFQGENPNGLTMDQAGNLYGTTDSGGYFGHDCNDWGGCGTVFELAPTASGWVFTTLYEFRGDTDGALPQDALRLGPDGNFYGTTRSGGGMGCFERRSCGTVFKISRGPSGSWTESVLHRFTGQPDGEQPSDSIAFDGGGSIYLTTLSGGLYNEGAVIKLRLANGTWTDDVLYSFTGGYDGGLPASEVTFDPAGNLYGTTYYGGEFGDGTVFQLRPATSGWVENVIYSFQYGSGGMNPTAGLIRDRLGNLYGGTFWRGPSPIGGVGGVGGNIFMLTPTADEWSFKVVHSFAGSKGGGYTGLNATMVMDRSGNLYGSRLGNLTGGDWGSIFRLTPSGGGWTYTSLYDFDGTDGNGPSGVILDANGNLYGTTVWGGANGGGVAWELTP